jgi:hypothetical protein
MYELRSLHAFTITREQYNYLLPVFGIAAQGETRLLCRQNPDGREMYSFIGNKEDYQDMLNRCKYLD